MRQIIISLLTVAALVGCSGGGKSDYKIDELYPSKNPDILQSAQVQYFDRRHYLFEAVEMGSHLRSSQFEETYRNWFSYVQDRRGDHWKNEDHSGYLDYNIGCNLFPLVLDNLYFKNTGEKIKRGDIGYMCFSRKNECFYFMKIDFNKPFREQDCLCDIEKGETKENE